MKTLIHHLKDPENPLLRQWCCLLISVLWQDFPEAKWKGVKESAHQRLCDLTLDPVPEVRAAALHALNTFLGIPDITEMVRLHEESVASTVLPMAADGNAMVRRELLVFLSTFVVRYKSKFLVTAYEQLMDQRHEILNPGATEPTMNGHRRGLSEASTTGNEGCPAVSTDSIQASVWRNILTMSVDAHPEIAQDASTIAQYVYEALLESPLSAQTRSIVEEITKLSRRPATLSRQSSATPLSRIKEPPSTAPRTLTRNESFLSVGIRRTASVAAALKQLTIGGSSAQDGGTEGINRSSAPNGSPPKRVPPGHRSRVPSEWTRPDEKDTTATSNAYKSNKVPKTKGFKPRDPDEAPVLPLQSEFFDWAIEVLHTSRCLLSL